MLPSYKAFSTILAVFALLAIAFPLVLVMGFLSINEAQSGTVQYSGEAALALAESCAEDTLLQLRDAPDYAENVLHLPEGDCNLDISEDGSERTVVVTAAKGDATRRLRITVTVAAVGIELMSWAEDSAS